MLKKKAITRVVVFPDIHAPKQDKQCMGVALDFTRDYKPDIFIQLGDLCDFDSISRFDTARERDLIGFVQEVKAANQVLDQIENVLPKGCRKVLLEGNHDRRPETYRMNRWDSKVQDILGIPRMENYDVLYRLKERGWENYDYGEAFKLGKAIFAHGWFVNQYHAAKTVRRWFKTIIYGHTHMYQVHTINGMDGLPVAGMSIGTLSKFNLSYLKGLPPDWVHMFMYMDFLQDGSFTPHPVPIIKGRFVANGKLYS